MIKKAMLDFSAFIGQKGELHVKEFSVIDVDTLRSQHWIFKPPKEGDAVSRNSTTRWIGKYYHGIDYDTGYADYKALDDALNMCDGACLLYAATREIALALEKLFDWTRAVFSLQDLGCDLPISNSMPLTGCLSAVDEEEDNCLHHHMFATEFNCTLRTARKLAKWCKLNTFSIDMNDAKNREKTFYDWKQRHPSPRCLAEQGFVRTHSDYDSTKCVYCGLMLSQWMEFDIVDEDHAYNAPYCKFVKRQQQAAASDTCATARKPTDISEKDLFSCCKA